VLVVLAGALALLAIASAFMAAPALYGDDLSTPFAHRDAAWSGSTACQSCHPDHHASWHRTFHRRMTQQATPASVLGAFDGRAVTFQGVTTRPIRDGNGYVFERLDGAGRVVDRQRVALTVGSRRYQQYVVEAPAGQEGGNRYRVPLLWHVADARWIHLSGAFLDSDASQSFDSHVGLWNQNCIFCHNTGPEPGIRNFEEMGRRAARGEALTGFEARYDSRVAEYGIACESCHAPGSEHAARNRSPLRRYLLHLTGKADPTIVNPDRLDQRRAVDVCGQCHGQRIPNPPQAIAVWNTTGPVYRAGEILRTSASPVTIDTPGLPGDPDVFRLRFWTDGTPRLTAYEYQGLTSSKCYLEGAMTCGSCHTMHGGDIRGQIEPAMRTSKACAGCHADIVSTPSAHTHHRADSSGSDCYACHMPKMVYGVLEIHRTHRIHNPAPADAARYARPDACTGCHLNRSLQWAAAASRAWWGRGRVDRYPTPVLRADGAPVELADTTASLLAGDPVQRVVAARLAGRRDTPIPVAERAFLWPLLLASLEDDYPTVRYFARNSLMALDRELPTAGFGEALRQFDYLADQPVRRRHVDELWRLWRARAKDGLPAPHAGTLLVDERYELTPDRVNALIALQARKRINIGE
jgi:predicted CXXCH cytochrome family protein